MERSQKEAIRRNRVKLVNFITVDELYVHLEEAGIFKEMALEYIQAEGPRPAQVQRLLSDLGRRPPTDFEKFCKCLVDTGQGHLAELLRNTEEDVRSRGRGCHRNNNTSQSRTSVVEQQASGSSIESQTLTTVSPETNEHQTLQIVSQATNEDERFQYGVGRYSEPEQSMELDPDPPASSGQGQSEVEGQVQGGDTEIKTVMPSDDDAYPMNSNPRGCCLIVNNEKFEDKVNGKRYDKRAGSTKDAEDISRLFTELGYQTEIKHNLSAQMLIITLKDFAKLEFHGDVDSCIVVLLSHGVDGAIVGSDCENVPLQDLFSYFDGQNCPKLLRKPKLFFIQACRGAREDAGCVAQDGTTQTDVEPFRSYTLCYDLQRHLPTEGDFLVAYATTAGNVSYRNTAEGSWFMQTICRVFRENWHQADILSMLTKVNNEMSRKTSQTSFCKQIPNPHFTLTKRFFFR